MTQETTYRASGNDYYLSSCRYKAYMLAESSRGKYAGWKFNSVEAELSLTPSAIKNETGFFHLLAPWYMKIIVSKKERLVEERLQSIPKVHVLY